MSPGDHKPPPTIHHALMIAAQVGAEAEGREAAEWVTGLDPERWAPRLITTQPSSNRGLAAIESSACEAWDLPDLMSGGAMPEFILALIESREIGVVQIVESRLGYDLLPDIACLERAPVIVARMPVPGPGETGYETYVGRRYGNLIDAFSVADEAVKEALVAQFIPPSKIEVIPPGPDSAAAHAALYSRLLDARPASSRWRADELFGAGEEAAASPAVATGPPIRLPRDPTPERSVGIIVPCFRHGIFIAECIESIKAQTLVPDRIVVVDDGSDDPETVAALAELDRDPTITVLRQESNRGPSAARNRALEELQTNYVLPIDADDKLLPDAVELMVGQLERAPEDVGFVYPHVRHFGNRDDFARMPAYNLWLLMIENYCPAPALFDRRVFDAGGVRYPEEIVVGHEDWDLVLQLGGRGVQGIHAGGPTFLYRRLGFSRVNAIDYGPHHFHDLVRQRHAVLYENAEAVKVEWAPAVSILLLDGEEVSWSADDLDAVREQTCVDFELLASTALTPRVRPVGDPDASPTAWLQTALDEARGRWLCVLTPGAVAALANPVFVERLIVGFDSRHSTTHAVAFAVPPTPGRPALALLEEEERRQAQPVGFALERHAAYNLPTLDLPGEGELLADLLLELQLTKAIEWRASPTPARPTPGPVSETAAVRLDFDPSLDRSEFATRDLIAHQPARMPKGELRSPRRWDDDKVWKPPATAFLCRHVATDGSRRMVADNPGSPPGYVLEFILGAIHREGAPFLRRLVDDDGDYSLTDEQGTLGGDRIPLGYVNQQPLPLLDRLELRRLPDSGELVLVAGERDPLFDLAEPVDELGWIEPLPLNPLDPDPQLGPWRTIDLRRLAGGDGHAHRYATGSEGTFLGSLYPRHSKGLVALRRRTDGRLLSDLAAPGRASRNPKRIAGWIAAGGGGDAPAARAARLMRGGRSRSEDPGEPLGFLRSEGEGAPGHFPLFSTTHPVTGDQLVTARPEVAIAHGYLADGILGWIYLPAEGPNDLGD